MSEQTKSNEIDNDSGSASSAGQVDITPDQDGGVLKEIRRQGTGEECPPGCGETVVVHYVGTLLDGTQFDSSRDRGEKFEFKLGTGSVIRAWELGVATMHKGELAVFTCRADYAYGESGSPPEIPPNATLVFEVELSDWKGEDLSPDNDGGIERRILKKGEGHVSPNDGASCTVHIVGKYESQVFEDRMVDFEMGEGSEQGIVEGVEHALQKFKKGEKSRLNVSPKYAYGEQGSTQYNIPAGATLEYEVELLKFEKVKASWDLDPEEKLEQAEITKTKGGTHFKAGKYEMACKCYNKMKDLLQCEDDVKDDDEKKKKDSLILAAHLNLALCYLKLEDDNKAIKECECALEKDANNIKGLFRRGQGNANRHDYNLALKDFAKIVELEPENKAAKNQLAVVRQKIKQEQDKEKKLYGGMFNKFAEADIRRKRVEMERDAAQSGLNNIGEWSNDLAKGFMPLDEEAAAFEDSNVDVPHYNHKG